MGYITFTLKEDADKAVEELNNGPFGAAGRKIRVEWAGDKVHSPPESEPLSTIREAIYRF